MPPTLGRAPAASTPRAEPSSSHSRLLVADSITLLLGLGYAVAASRGWQTLVPVTGAWGGLAATLVIGAVAGLYPAGRAARLNPTDALRTS